MTPAEVRRLFGTPDRIQRLGESETGKPISDWTYRRHGLVAEFRLVKGSRLSLGNSPQTVFVLRRGSVKEVRILIAFP